MRPDENAVPELVQEPFLLPRSVQVGCHLSYPIAVRGLNLYRSISASGVELRHLDGLPISKAVIIAGSINPSNVERWVRVAKVANRNELQRMVDRAWEVGISRCATDERWALRQALGEQEQTSERVKPVVTFLKRGISFRVAAEARLEPVASNKNSETC